MVRRSGFIGALAQVQREIERSQRASARAQNAAFRDQQRAIREAERAQQAAISASKRAATEAERDRKRLHQEAQTARVDNMNADIEVRLDALQHLLHHTLDVDDYLDLDDLKEIYTPPTFNPGKLTTAGPPPHKPLLPVPPSGLARLRKKNVAAHEEETRMAEERYADEWANYERKEQHRIDELDAALKKHEDQIAEERARCSLQHEEIEVFKDELASDDADAIVAYFGLVLQSSLYPDDFPTHRLVAYIPESRQLVVEIDLPMLSVIPNIRAHRYVKTRDNISDAARPVSEIKRLYADVIAQVTVRTLHELYEADRERWIDTIVLNGRVDAVDPGTGRDVHPYLLSVRTTREEFANLDLTRVEPIACLKSLNAVVSRKPTELAPIRPVLELSMVDSRFVEETNVSSEERP